ncbi:MAG: hypothetical protein IK102_05010 [Treponema sp.]|nr:hypothetical protein [Treponema sp.]
MSKSKLFSIITIACFVSILCIPIGIVLMLYYTNWKKKLKVILSLALTAFYAGLIVLVFFVKPSINTGGIGLPFGANGGYTAFDAGSGGSGSGGKGRGSKKPGELLPQQSEQTKAKGKGNGAAIYPILFFLFMLFLILWQNLRSKGKSNYENPYVDTNKYKLPLGPDSKMPMVHFLHIELGSDEKINFATETNQKDNEGNLVITNQRVIILNKTEIIELPVASVKSVSSATSTVLVIAADDKKYYVFMPENQMKYATAVLKWTTGKTQI